MDFFSQLGPHPNLDEMQDNVVMKKLRPRINNQWRTHPVRVFSFVFLFGRVNGLNEDDDGWLLF